MSAKFWSDDFDMDLPKIIPGAKELLGDLADIELLTHGHATYGGLNHPSCWNASSGSVAFFGRTAPHKPTHYFTSDPTVRCTLWEAIRDAWVHDFVLMFEGNPVWTPQYHHFQPIMFHIRKILEIPRPEFEDHVFEVMEALVRCRRLVKNLISASAIDRRIVSQTGDAP
jgi:hypothetical protein